MKERKIIRGEGGINSRGGGIGGGVREEEGNKKKEEEEKKWREGRKKES